MEPIGQLGIIVVIVILAMLIIPIVNPHQTYFWQRRKVAQTGENISKPFYPTIKETRKPDGTQSALLTLSGRYREEYWGSIYWLDGHPTDTDLQGEQGLNGRTLQYWKFHADADWRDKEKLEADMQRYSDTFYSHVKDVMADMEKQGWQQSGSWRTVRKVADLNGGSTNIINLIHTL